MRIGTIGQTLACDVANNIQHMYAKQGADSIISYGKDKFIIRATHDNDKYIKTVLELDEKGAVGNAYSTLMPNAAKFKEELIAFFTK